MDVQDFKALIDNLIKSAKSAVDKATFARVKTHLVSAHKLAVCTAPIVSALHELADKRMLPTLPQSQAGLPGSSLC